MITSSCQPRCAGVCIRAASQQVLTANYVKIFRAECMVCTFRTGMPRLIALLVAQH